MDDDSAFSFSFVSYLTEDREREMWLIQPCPSHNYTRNKEMGIKQPLISATQKSCLFFFFFPRRLDLLIKGFTKNNYGFEISIYFVQKNDSI